MAIQVKNTVKSVERAEALDFAKVALRNAGFEISRMCTSRTSCFDFAVRKEETLVFIKVIHNIRDVSRSDAVELKTMADWFNCTSLIISDVNGGQMLSNDTIYSRYGAHVVTSKTLEDVVHGTHPLIEATPGGYYVRTDGGKIRERRRELGLSIGKLASMVSVSRRALYGYEREMTRASISAAYQLAEILGVPIVKSINILENNSSSHDIPKKINFRGSPNRNVRNRFLSFVTEKLSKFGWNVFVTNRSPFDFVAFLPRKKLKLIGGILKEYEEGVKDRMEEIASLGKVIEAKSVLLSKENVTFDHGITFFSFDEFEKVPDKQTLEIMLK